MPYIAALECEVCGLEFDFTTGIGRLHTPPNAAPDMLAAVQLFEMIDAKLRKISVLAGSQWHTVYERGADQHWRLDA